MTLGVDVYGLMHSLALPRQLRNGNVYNSKLIRMIPTHWLWASSTLKPTTLPARYKISWLTVVNSNFGLELQWKPTQRTSGIENFPKNVLTNLVGLIPVIGPILEIAFPLAWKMISDPDSAFEELNNLIPGIDLADLIIREKILKLCEEVKQYMAQGWVQLSLPAQPRQVQDLNVGEADSSRPTRLQDLEMSLVFVLAGEILAKKHLVPPPDDQSAHSHTGIGRSGPGEIVLTNPAAAAPADDEQESS